MSEDRSFGLILKAALFATGCAGIVAEFVLSTLATYLLGNAIFQWTVMMSLMLFAMGVGSRLSRFFRKNLLDAFVMTEFTLSVLCALSAILAYSLAGFLECFQWIIYVQAMVIGSLIGLEIPLVTRMNDAYEELRINISGVMEKDYYGALFGGIIFAFFALPYLGLTYTPIVLGSINFLVAGLILWRFYDLLERKRLLVSAFAGVFCLLLLLGFFANPVITYAEQRRYADKVIFSAQTPYQKIVMTRWKNDYWLYLNGQEQFSTVDEERYHEPLVHPAMMLTPDRSRVLILGGGDGLALREVLKYKDVQSVTLVDLDPEMTQLGQTHPMLLSVNRYSMLDDRVTIINMDAAGFLQKDDSHYGVIIADLPDPDSVDLMHVYSVDFYGNAKSRLIRGGVFVTQAASPYFARMAFQCILKTVRAAGFSAVPYHNSIPTLGEWGWVMGVPKEEMDAARLKSLIMAIDFDGLDTRFLNTDAVVSMLHFGKGVLEEETMAGIGVNSRTRPVLYKYYMEGSWGIY